MLGCCEERSQGRKKRGVRGEIRKWCCRGKKEDRFNGILPTVGVLPALSDVFEDNEEELSALASGAVGGGLALDILGGLNGRT